MLSSNQFFTPMDALELHKKGIIKLGKTLVRDYAGRTFRVMRFDYHNGVFKMFLEFPNGDHEPVSKADIRNMKLEIVPEEGVKQTEWEDPP